MPHQVETFKEWAPESYDSCVQDCVEAIQELDRPMDADTRSVLAVLMPGLDPTRSASYINTLNQSKQAGQQQAKPNPQSAALKKVPESHMTPSQMRYT